MIPNAVDPEIFFPPAERRRGSRLRVIATSWSDNPRKGAGTLRRAGSRGPIPTATELTFAGRSQVPFEGVRQLGPLRRPRASPGAAGARRIYVAASVNEPCSNALLEALGCGLPALYRRSSSHRGAASATARLGFDDEGGGGEPARPPCRGSSTSGEERSGLRPLAAVADEYLRVARHDGRMRVRLRTPRRWLAAAAGTQSTIEGADG